MLNKESFLNHLEALRQTLLRGLAAFALLLIPAAVLVHHLLPLLLRHLSSWIPGYKFYYMTPLEPFFVELKLTAAAALLLGLPVHFFLWGKFLAPALYAHEKRIAGWLLGGALGLFSAGAALALFGVLPMLLRFSAGFATEEWQPMLTFNSLLSLAALLVLGFGLIFQLPIVILLLVRGGVIRSATLRQHRPAVLVGILILAAVLTPPDVISQCMMAIPAYVFFELSLFAAARMEKRREEQESREEVPPADTTVRQPVDAEIPQTPAVPQEKPQETWQDDTEIPDVYNRHRRGLRQGRPRRYR